MYNSVGRFCDGFSSFGRFGIGGYMMMGIGLVLVLLVVYLLYKKGSYLKSEGTESPLDTLKTRYVNGEIDEEEYLKKKEILKS